MPKLSNLDGLRLVNPRTAERVEEALAIQEQEAKEAGKLGYLGRIHVQATPPHFSPGPYLRV